MEHYHSTPLSSPRIRSSMWALFLAAGAIIALLWVYGCSAISKVYSQPSAFPSAQTLEGDCAAGQALTPPVRSNSCDLYQAIAQFCMGQAMLPINAVQACTIAGYPVSAVASGLVPSPVPKPAGM